MVRGRQPGRKGEGRKIRINGAESITQNLTGHETEIVVLSLCVSVRLIGTNSVLLWGTERERDYSLW